MRVLQEALGAWRREWMGRIALAASREIATLDYVGSAPEFRDALFDFATDRTLLAQIDLTRLVPGIGPPRFALFLDKLALARARAYG